MMVIAAVAASLTAAALLAAGGPLPRLLAVAVGVADLVWPLWLPPPLPAPAASSALARLVAAVGASWGLVRIVDLVRERPARPAALRVWHAFAGFDTRETARARPRLDAVGFAAALAFGCVAVGAALLATRAPDRPLRWLAGAVFVYTVAETIDRGARAAYAAAGVVVAPIQRFPLAARSVGEFWGARWNRIVGRWLERHVFRPLARRRHAAAGLVVTFAVSAALHAYHAWAGFGAAMAAVMGAFFLVQALLVGVERALGVARWPVAAARAWTVCALLVTSPLFVEPALQLLGSR